jgi:hypothetical protein
MPKTNIGKVLRRMLGLGETARATEAPLLLIHVNGRNRHKSYVLHRLIAWGGHVQSRDRTGTGVHRACACGRPGDTERHPRARRLHHAGIARAERHTGGSRRNINIAGDSDGSEAYRDAALSASTETSVTVSS